MALPEMLTNARLGATKWKTALVYGLPPIRAIQSSLTLGK
jgi:hypothetical protein